MKNFIKQTSILSVAITIAFVVYMGVQIAQGAGTWNPPSAVPPGNNTDEPINVSNSPQTKSGSLEVGGLLSNYSAYLATVSGSVGIGTASPSVGGVQDLKLDVEGAVGAEFYCDQNGDNCKTITAMGGGEGVLEKGTALYKTTSCTTQSWCADPDRTRSLGTANIVTTESSTGYSSSCLNMWGDPVTVSCTASNTFIGYSVDAVIYNNYSQSFNTGSAILNCPSGESIVSGGQTGCPSESDETLVYNGISGNGWKVECSDADGGGVSFTINITCAK